MGSGGLRGASEKERELGPLERDPDGELGFFIRLLSFEIEGERIMRGEGDGFFFFV